MSQSKKRVICYIDGFNLYHAVAALGPRDNYLKWVNLWRLASAFIRTSSEQLVDVYYFTALAHWLPASKARHEAFLKANKHYGVKTVLGHFKKKQKICPQCGASWQTHEEKQSDVNLSIYLLHHAHQHLFDKALVMTADSDMCGVIDLVLHSYPDKEITVLVPPGRYIISRELRAQVETRKIKRKHLTANLLEELVLDRNGTLVTRRPTEYAP